MSTWVNKMIGRFSKDDFDLHGIDFCTISDKGTRNYQEDAVIAQRAATPGHAICVLADGMGGHAAGDVASRIVSETIFKRLEDADIAALSFDEIKDMLLKISQEANTALEDHVKSNKKAKGLGSTVVAVVFKDRKFCWVSIGDSPLYLYRNNELTQLNADHSMAVQIDQMASVGMMSQEQADNHPDRSSLTSALMGKDIPFIDLPEETFELKENDIIVVSSDGLQSLKNHDIAQVLAKNKDKPADDIGAELMTAVKSLNRKHQDNVGIFVAKFSR